MNWGRDHMREQLAKMPSEDAVQNVVHFPADAAQPRYAKSSALDLISRAATMMRDLESRAAKSEARARALAESVIEKLELAEVRIREADAARAQAEDNVDRLNARLQEAERELARTEAQIVAGESELAAAERLVRAAQARAIESERAVSQIEDAIRSQLITLECNLTEQPRRAA
jgi:hypothetical protein